MSNIGGVADCAVSLMNVAVYFLIAAAFIFTLYGSLRFIGAEGESRSEWRRVMTYGIISLFVMVSIWGIVNLLTNTFGLNNESIKAPKIEIRQ